MSTRAREVRHRCGIEHGADVRCTASIQSVNMAKHQRNQREVQESNAGLLSLHKDNDKCPLHAFSKHSLYITVIAMGLKIGIIILRASCYMHSKFHQMLDLFNRRVEVLINQE